MDSPTSPFYSILTSNSFPARTFQRDAVELGFARDADAAPDAKTTDVAKESDWNSNQRDGGNKLRAELETIPKDHDFHGIVTPEPHPYPYNKESAFGLRGEASPLVRKAHGIIIDHVDFCKLNMSWIMSQVNIVGHLQHLTSRGEAAAGLRRIFDIREQFNFSTDEAFRETVLDPLVKYFPDARKHAEQHPSDANVIYLNWEESHPRHYHIGRSTSSRLAKYWANGTVEGDEAINQLVPAGHQGTRTPVVRGVILINFAGDPLYDNTDFPVSAYMAVEVLEAIKTMLLTPEQGLKVCDGMQTYGGKRVFPDDANFADRLSRVVNNIKSGVYLPVKREEYGSDFAFMNSLAKGVDDSNKAPLSVVRRKMVEKAGVSSLYKELLAARARLRDMKNDEEFFRHFYDLVDWLEISCHF